MKSRAQKNNMRSRERSFERRRDEHRYNHHAELHQISFKSLTRGIAGYKNSELQGFPTLVSTCIQWQTNVSKQKHTDIWNQKVR